MKGGQHQVFAVTLTTTSDFLRVLLSIFLFGSTHTKEHITLVASRGAGAGAYFHTLKFSTITDKTLTCLRLQAAGEIFFIDQQYATPILTTYFFKYQNDIHL